MTDRALNERCIVVTGLPGSGKTRVIQAALTQLPRLTKEMSLVESSDARLMRKEGSSLIIDQVWCVVDVRTFFQLPRDAWLADELKVLLEQADGIVFSFVEGASLEIQAQWSRWVRQYAKELPIVRWLNQQFPKDWHGFTANRGGEKFNLPPLPRRHSFSFKVGKLSLKHLLFGLDSSKQNLGMKIIRVKGVVETFEYVNLVAIEGSALRWDTFAAKPKEVAGILVIEGIDLERCWLEELVNASLLVGGKVDAH